MKRLSRGGFFREHFTTLKRRCERAGFLVRQWKNRTTREWRLCKFRLTFLFTMMVLTVCYLLAQPTVADDLVLARSVLEDAAGNLTIADVAGREFQPIGPTLSKGYSDSAYWLRLRVRAPANGNQVVLFIRQ